MLSSMWVVWMTAIINDWVLFFLGAFSALGGILIFFGRKLNILDSLAVKIAKMEDSDLVTHPVHEKMCRDTTDRFLQLVNDLASSIEKMDERREQARAENERQAQDLLRRMTRMETSLEFLVREKTK